MPDGDEDAVVTGVLASDGVEDASVLGVLVPGGVEVSKVLVPDELENSLVT